MAAEAGAVFVELVLTIDPEVAASRFVERTRGSGREGIWGDLPADMATVVEDLEHFLRTRADVYRIAAAGGDPVDQLDQALRRRRDR